MSAGLTPIQVTDNEVKPDVNYIVKDRRDELPVDLSVYSVLVIEMYVRPQRSSDTSFVTVGSLHTDGTDGEVVFPVRPDFNGLDAGSYEGQIVLTADGDRIVLHELVKFKLTTAFSEV